MATFCRKSFALSFFPRTFSFLFNWDGVSNSGMWDNPESKLELIFPISYRPKSFSLSLEADKELALTAIGT